MYIQKKEKAQAGELPLNYHRRHWMRQQGLTNGMLAGRFGLKSDMSVSRMMNKGIALQEYINILRDEYDMPEHLLPVPSRGKSGPYTKEEREAMGLAVA